jgi:hypothetical protein
MMGPTKRIRSINPAARDIPSELPDEPLRVRRSDTPSQVVVSLTEPARSDAAGEHRGADGWRKAPKGIALGLLLAIPFWVALAIVVVWFLR